MQARTALVMRTAVLPYRELHQLHKLCNLQGWRQLLRSEVRTYEKPYRYSKGKPCDSCSDWLKSLSTRTLPSALLALPLREDAVLSLRHQPQAKCGKKRPSLFPQGCFGHFRKDVDAVQMLHPLATLLLASDSFRCAFARVTTLLCNFRRFDSS